MRMQGQLDTALSDTRPLAGGARSPQALAGEGIEAIFASDLARALRHRRSALGRAGSACR